MPASNIELTRGHASIVRTFPLKKVCSYIKLLNITMYYERKFCKHNNLISESDFMMIYNDEVTHVKTLMNY